MQVAGRHPDRVVGTEPYPVEQQRDHDPDVARIVRGQLRGERVRAGDRGHQFRPVLDRPRHDQLDGPAQPLLGRPGPQRHDHRLELVDAQRLQQVGRGGRITEPAQPLELPDRDQQFGLVVWVAVAGMAGGVRLRRPDRVRMRLDRQGRVGGEQLEQVRQADPELGHDGVAEQPRRVGGDGLRQRPAGQVGGRPVVRAQPQLGLGAVARHRAALDGGDRLPGTPRVGTDLPVQRLHVHAPRSMSGSR